MEDAVTIEHLLTKGSTVPFTQASAVLEQNQARSRAASRTRALTATVVVVGPAGRLPEAGDALCELGEAYGVRTILISPGSNPAPPVEVQGCAIALAGMKPEYVNNAVAALRLSSLPTIVWWRGGDPGTLEGVVDLAERVVLDDQAVDPVPCWRTATELFPRAAFSDLRWTRLTPWRALMAHFFDVAEVRASTASFRRLVVSASDRPSAALFGSWLTAALAPSARIETVVKPASSDGPIEEIRLEGPSMELVLKLADSRTCVEAASAHGRRTTSRTVSLGEQGLAALLAEELQVRAHDRAFEAAVGRVVGR
jgi:glucose-6-phosphate dehydrogenase assembly protein OpcA